MLHPWRRLGTACSSLGGGWERPAPPLSRGRPGGGWGYLIPERPHPHPYPPLEGEGVTQDTPCAIDAAPCAIANMYYNLCSLCRWFAPPLSRGRPGGGWGYLIPERPHPHPCPPLEGEGVTQDTPCAIDAAPGAIANMHYNLCSSRDSVIVDIPFTKSRSETP